MERTELIANNLNLAFTELIYTPHFINNKNWDGFSDVVGNAMKNGILFQLQSNDFYDLDVASQLKAKEEADKAAKMLGEFWFDLWS
jgi:hypothetical protein